MNKKIKSSVAGMNENGAVTIVEYVYKDGKLIRKVETLYSNDDVKIIEKKRK